MLDNQRVSVENLTRKSITVRTVVPLVNARQISQKLPTKQVINLSDQKGGGISEIFEKLKVEFSLKFFIFMFRLKQVLNLNPNTVNIEI